ncbi:MAG: glycosyltransferase [Chloroflexi bacterium]|nr:glycosyltransferase [Chloroflexota bacterium]
MNRPYVPQTVLDAAHARSAARATRQWGEADRLRDEIVAAGWRVIDSGTNFRLEPASPPDAVDGDLVRYGRSAAVPSRMEEEATARATVLIVATDAPASAGRSISGASAQLGAEDQLLVLLDGPNPGLESELGILPTDVEVIRTATPLGAAAAINIGLRRAVGEVVILLDPELEPVGDFITPLVSALSDADVAVAGARGRRTPDLRAIEDVRDPGDATTIARGVLAFRRADGISAAPIDEGLVSGRHVDSWWSLTLRAGTGVVAGDPVRRAVVIGGLPVQPIDGFDVPAQEAPDATRQARRNFYRVFKKFRDRPDLLGRGPE